MDANTIIGQTKDHFCRNMDQDVINDENGFIFNKK
jgi:hypothetical protein